jgi:hypothetical protein
MFTIVFNGTGEYKIAILPRGQKVNSTYFIEYALRSLTEICYLEGNGAYGRRVVLHFHNAPVHNTEGLERAWRILDSNDWSIRLIVQT